MKKLLIIPMILMGTLLYKPASAQIGFGIHINLGTPVYVEQAPVYDDDNYFYLPDVGAYYSVDHNCYYYQDGGRWLTATYLPGAYHDYDWRSARHYEVHDHRPFLHDDVYRSRYSGFGGDHNWAYRENHDAKPYGGHEYAEQNNWRGNGYGHAYPQNDNHGYEKRNEGYGQRNDNRNSQPQNDNRGFQQRNDDHGQRGNDNRGFQQRNDDHGQRGYDNRGRDGRRD